MRLRTRLTVAAGIIVAVASVSVGYVGLLATERAQIRGLDAVLAAGAQQVSAAKQSPLTAALLVAEQSQVALTIAIRDINGEITPMRFSRAVIDPKTSLSTLRAATKTAISQHNKGDYRLRTVELPSDEFILIATTLADVDNTRQRGLQFLLLALLLSVGFGVTVVFLLVRRDLKVVEGLIDVADRMSQGNTDVEIPIGSSTSEVDSLARSLRSMVDSLNGVVKRERELSTQMQTFLGDASHELRTPLTVVRGYAELLSRNPQFQGETEQKYLSRISSEIARMEALISDLLLLTETGSRPLRESVDVNLTALAQQFVTDLKELTPERPVRSEIDPEVVVQGSYELLTQVFANLFRNIELHTPNNAQVQIRLVQRTSSAVLTIADAGPGLSDEMYSAGIHAFQRFDPSRSRDTGGSGLGMSIIAAVVSHHGGTIQLAPSELGGLKTTITLPVQPVMEGSAP
ncbi:MAG: sensor histidine kinase [Actinobacteria bacterium]|nr:sensor histidine kinase [Actinomycetota bacterium]